MQRRWILLAGGFLFGASTVLPVVTTSFNYLDISEFKDAIPTLQAMIEDSHESSFRNAKTVYSFAIELVAFLRDELGVAPDADLPEPYFACGDLAGMYKEAERMKSNGLKRVYEKAYATAIINLTLSIFSEVVGSEVLRFEANIRTFDFLFGVKDLNKQPSDEGARDAT
jgi:hypothetical protein